MKIDYYKTLKEMVDSARFESDDLETTVLYVPDLFQALSNVLDEDVLSQEDRVMINCAIGYLAVCDDVVPEDVYGIKGLMDDLFVLSLVLKQTMTKYPDMVHKAWTNTVNDFPIDKVLDICYDRSYKVLSDENLLDKVLVYSGLEPL